MDISIDRENARKLGGAAFLIRIQFRQNTSWQGTIQWLDEKKTAHFRSMLEMILLMHEALVTNSSENLANRKHAWAKK
ncbi:MAG: hypothetical protein GX200_05850 [Firmicutes bacterium]|nr:hypothetical protein [Bacillota bacterium]